MNKQRILSKANQFARNMARFLGLGMGFREIAKDRKRYVELNKDSSFSMDKRFDYICAFDKYANNGRLDNEYFIQDIWGARKVLENKPSIHYDVGSAVAGFIAHLCAIKQRVVLIDIRPMDNNFNTPFLQQMGGGRIHTSKCYKFR